MKELKWYVAYTHSRSERKVHAQMRLHNIESFLPMHKVKRKWSDRVKYVEVPLFPSYVFIRTHISKIPYLISGTHGIATFISFEGKYAIIKESEIALINKIIRTNQDMSVETGPLKKGKRVKIEHGAFSGFEGIIQRNQNKYRLIVEIKGIRQNLSIDIPIMHLDKIYQSSSL